MYARRDSLNAFINNHWPISVKLFAPLCTPTWPAQWHVVAIFAIENTVLVSQELNNTYIFTEKDGNILQGDVSRLADTSVGRELTYLESIADKVAAGHSGFHSAFYVDNKHTTAKIFDKEYKLYDRYADHVVDAAIMIKLRNEYLAVTAAMRLILPQTLARELAAAISDNYTFFCRKTEI